MTVIFPESGLWRSYHLFYHGDLDRAVRLFVQPTVATLLDDGSIDSFYFVRYGLGGPHLRLRIRPVPDRALDADAVVERVATEFLDRWPSTEPLETEELQRRQRIFLADSREEDVRTYPDNSLRKFPVRFELERYGGPELFPASLDVFALSSVAALDFLAGNEAEPRPRLLARQLRLLIRQAWGFSSDGAFFLDLVRYPILTWGEAMHGIVKRGDEAYGRNQQRFQDLIRVELENLARPAEGAHEPSRSSMLLSEGARLLAATLETADPTLRLRVSTAQLHMTANRLGLQNSYETYLGRLLVRAAEDLKASDPPRWESYWNDRPELPPGSSSDLVRRSFDVFQRRS